jgi:aryl-alcohol dehydrogenase-like predicted oxidoreductase
MEMREFGGTGIRASAVGLGCNNFVADPETPREETLRALDDLCAKARCARSARRWF